MTYRKKLIEVALPLDAINEGSKPETDNPFLRGHPRSIHNWWARTPLSVCRAVLFAQIIDDPGNDLPPDKALLERSKLMEFVSRLATWDGMSNEALLDQARGLILQTCRSTSLQFWDMFAGRASIPLEAQRLGLSVISSDLNPVAVLIQKGLLEIPLVFRSQLPVNPEAAGYLGRGAAWSSRQGLASDVRYYANWMQNQLRERIKHLYPRVSLPKQHGNGDATVEAWLWTRTIKCPNPACGARTPLVRSFWLSNQGDSPSFVDPVPNHERKTVHFKIGNAGRPQKETSNRTAARCIFCNTIIKKPQLRELATQFGIEELPMALVCGGSHSHLYLPFETVDIPFVQRPVVPDLRLPITNDRRWFSPPLYGLLNFDDLFTTRQLIALTTLSDLVHEARNLVLHDALVAGMSSENRPLADGGTGAQAYSDAVAVYLGCALSRLTDYMNSLCTWNPTNENIGHLFQRQAIPMVWDFAEANPIDGKLTISSTGEWVADAIMSCPASDVPPRVIQLDARSLETSPVSHAIISTDPPYYDNIGYADLSDFFYVWLRRTLREILPNLFSTLLTPKEQELIASPYRHQGSEELARAHFQQGFIKTFHALKNIVHSEIPMTVYYAFKQEEEETSDQRASTGWETMLDGLVSSGFQITGTWPVRTTKKARSVARGTNALASAVVLVCRPRTDDAPLATRREFITALRRELPDALKKLQQGNIAPVDFAQATIGPGMAIFSRYSKILEADGSPMRVRTALQLINQELETYFAEQEGDLDSDTRFCIAWFEQKGMEEGAFGEADVLARAKNTSVAGLVEAGVLKAKSGKVRLLKRDELLDDWNPLKDVRLTVWECAQYLIRALDLGGEEGAAKLAAQLGGGRSEDARALAYRLYAICERKGWTQDALAYNSIVASWGDVQAKVATERTFEQGKLL